MTYTVWYIGSQGVTTIAENVDAETAERIAEHPSMSAPGSVAILPSFADAPEATR